MAKVVNIDDYRKKEQSVKASFWNGEEWKSLRDECREPIAPQLTDEEIFEFIRMGIVRILMVEE